MTKLVFNVKTYFVRLYVYDIFYFCMEENITDKTLESHLKYFVLLVRISTRNIIIFYNH